jgi:hypothetical protein
LALEFRDLYSLLAIRLLLEPFHSSLIMRFCDINHGLHLPPMHYLAP